MNEGNSAGGRLPDASLAGAFLEKPTARPQPIAPEL